MKPTALFVLITSLAAGTTITLSSHHWLLAWMGLEINTLAIIPLMTSTPHPRAIEAATKYFLTQAAASTLMLFTALINAKAFGEWYITSISTSMSIPVTLAICMKLGLAPLHFWVPEVMQGIPLTTGLIVATWQKIPPMVLLLQISETTSLLLTTAFGLTSIILGGWGGLNQTQVRKIMAYSSISHMGWILLVLKFNPATALLTFLLYILMTTSLFIFLILLNTTKLPQISTTWPLTPSMTLIMLVTLLSIGGLPPLTGFIPKLLITLDLAQQKSLILACTALLASMPALYFYIRLTYIMLLITPPNTTHSKTTWRTPLKSPAIISMMISPAILLLPITPTLMNLIQ
uniref:NADH-ubiquinone oxidoreductase chain 2 n=1 Tax=Synapturanus sp. MNHN-RA-2020.0079 TaxID=2877830 RepID=A0A8K1LZ32_9NEOB|nr:NADH dehydrogenase subunit 2 [Synapturanus sp. MNHN-RA-2020.0079]